MLACGVSDFDAVVCRLEFIGTREMSSITIFCCFDFPGIDCFTFVNFSTI